MNEEAILAAARNNAAWCDAVCQAHGGLTALDDVLWRNAARSPRFYPNLVTLRPGLHAAVDDAIQHLDAAMPVGWGIKDSFADLDLRSRGFAQAFEAQWLWLESTPGAPASRYDDGIAWAVVATDAALVDWEHAWGAGNATTPRQFPARLLARPDIAFVQGRRDGDVVAGGILSAGGGAVGISNVFGEPDHLAACWASLAGQAAIRFPGLPLCGYERTGAIARPLALGFAAIGPLRVWLREA